MLQLNQSVSYAAAVAVSRRERRQAQAVSLARWPQSATTAPDERARRHAQHEAQGAAGTSPQCRRHPVHADAGRGPADGLRPHRAGAAPRTGAHRGPSRQGRIGLYRIQEKIFAKKVIVIIYLI